jgi:hypothetical protein
MARPLIMNPYPRWMSAIARIPRQRSGLRPRHQTSASLWTFSKSKDPKPSLLRYVPATYERAFLIFNLAAVNANSQASETAGCGIRHPSQMIPGMKSRRSVFLWACPLFSFVFLAHSLYPDTSRYHVIGHMAVFHLCGCS